MKIFDESVEFDRQLKSWMLDHAPGYWMAVSEDHMLVDWERKLAERLGYYRPQRHRNTNMEFLLPVALRERHPAYVKMFFANSKPKTLEARSDVPLELLDIDGKTHPCLVTLHPFDTTFCDGMCMIDYNGYRELALAHVLFLSDFGTLESDVNRGHRIRGLKLDAAVDNLIASAEDMSSRSRAK